MKSTIIRAMLWVVLWNMLFFSGCSIHFKGEKIELDTGPKIVYRLDSIGLFESNKTLWPVVVEIPGRNQFEGAYAQGHQ